MTLIARVLAGATLACGLATSAMAITPLDIRFESETPGLQQSTATFSTVGTLTFEDVGTGNDLSFLTDFGTGGAINGSYTGVDVIAADQYGGVGGTGRYGVTFGNDSYSLDLTTTLPGGVNYFGYWLSALDANNFVEFYSGDNLLFVFDPQDVINVVNAQTNPSQYFGNPNSNFAGQNSGEPYLFINFFNDNGNFDRIVFRQGPGGGYESDNHTVGRFITKGTGTIVPIPGVPEPASWAMLIAGFGLVGATMRRRRMMVQVSA